MTSATSTRETSLRKAAKRVTSRIAGNRVYTIRRGPARGFRRRGGFGWIPERVSGITPEHRFLRALDLRGLTAYDVGSFEGMVTLALSRAVGSEGRVVAFEPNPANAVRLRENLALNGVANVEIREHALGSAAGEASLAYTPGEGGCGTLTPAGDRARSLAVKVERLDTLLAAGLPPPAFIKIDVEGFEAEVLAGARETLRRHSPQLLVELHGYEEEDRRANAARVLEILESVGYRAEHVETGTAVDVETIGVAVEGHLLCSQPNGSARPAPTGRRPNGLRS